MGLILVIASWLLLWALGLDFPFLTGLVSGVCNLVPYLGAIMSWVPPFLRLGLKKYHSAASYLGIFSMLTFFHIVAANFLIPALIGWRVRLNGAGADSVTFVLGLVVGRHEIHPGDTDYGRGEGDLRSRGRLGTGGALARRIDPVMLSEGDE